MAAKQRLSSVAYSQTSTTRGSAAGSFGRKSATKACNELRSRFGEALPHDKRVHNALSLNAAANARAMEGAAASSGGDRIGPGSFFLYDPAELNKAASGGFSDALSRVLVVVNTRAAADQLVLRGFVLFTTLNQYDTETTGFSNLPFPTAQPSAERAAEIPLHQVAPPQGAVEALPTRMPPLHTGDASTMEKVIECFEVKVVDEESNCIWHPIRMWSQNSKERKNLGYRDGSNLNNRLAAYYAIKCGKTEVSALQGMSFSKLVQTGRTSKDGNGTFFDACIALYAS